MAINSIGGMTLPLATSQAGASQTTGKTALQQTRAGAPEQFLVRSTTGASAPTFGFIIDQRDEQSIRSQLRETLSTYFKIFYKRDSEANAAIDRTLGGMEGLIDRAVSDKNFTGFDLRLAQVATNYGDSSGSFASVQGIGLEIGLAKDGKVSVDDTELVDIQGRGIDLTKEQLAAGFQSARYERSENPSGAAAAGMPDQRLQNAIDQLRQTQDALRDFRNGDANALKPLIDRYLGGAGLTINA
ncbi:hypothetical protein [Oceanibaculum pacificum]|uniref:Uncharacterized protein n=1 Tax=Oceanibaculum pacificum TaxID=580166 RepID=A0A154WGK0_9PROT|nr:hypothetical protein [Oceanibaculum pacificum]KZD12637.1 hypothetical protein AUP43_15825 [Oceanibaculum pacificum]